MDFVTVGLGFSVSCSLASISYSIVWCLLPLLCTLLDLSDRASLAIAITFYLSLLSLFSRCSTGLTNDFSGDVYIIIMSADCNIYSQNCIEGCCDVDGRCPSMSGKQCYFIYQLQDRNSIVMFPLGILIAFAILIIIVQVALITLCLWWKPKKQP